MKRASGVFPLADGGAKPGRQQRPGRPDRRWSGGFFRPQPWLQSARELPHAAASAVAGVVVVAVGMWTVIALLTGGGQPALPSSHAVLVSVKPASSHTATGGGHLVWYRSGGLLVVDLGVKNLQPNARVSALLVPSATCTGSRPAGTRVLGTVRADGQGFAHFNDELLGVSNLRFSAFAIWVEGAGQGRSPSGCGVVSLSNGTLIGS